MKNENKLYYNCEDLVNMLGISTSAAYKIIRKLNEELREKNYIVLSGKVSKAYFDKRWYGHGA